MTREIRITAQKHTKVVQQTIAPGPREGLPVLIDGLLDRARNNRTDGRIVLNLRQGGVRSVVSEAFEEVEQR